MSHLWQFFLDDEPVAFLSSVLLQVTVIVICATLTLRLARRRPALRSTVGLVALFLVLLSPVFATAAWHFNVGWLTARVEAGRTEMGALSGALPERGNAEVLGVSPRMAQPSPRRLVPPAGLTALLPPIGYGLLSLWLSGTVFFLVRLALGLAALKRALRKLPASAEGFGPQLVEAQRQVGLRRLPRLAVSGAASSPFSAGFLNPSIVLPGYCRQLDQGSLRDILVHECAHLRRRDPLAGLAQALATAIFWFHPGIHRLNRALTAAQEDACDNFVLQRTPPQVYARRLVAIASRSHGSRPSFALGLALEQGCLSQRIADLLDARRDKMTHTGNVATLGVAAVSVALLLPIICLRVRAEETAPPAPTRGQDATERDDAPSTQEPLNKKEHLGYPREWPQAELFEKLNKKVNFIHQNLSLQEVLTKLGELSGVKIVVDPSVLENCRTRFNYAFTEASLCALLDEYTLRPAGLAYVVRDKAIYVSSAEALSAVQLQLYDIHDFGDEKILEAIETIIRHRVRPQSWGKQAGTSLERRRGKLVVMQTPEVHAIIGKLLDQLRQDSEIMILIDLVLLEKAKAAAVIRKLGKKIGDPLTADERQQLCREAKVLLSPKMTVLNAKAAHFSIGPERDPLALDQTDKAFRVGIKAVVSSEKKYVSLEVTGPDSGEDKVSVLTVRDGAAVIAKAAEVEFMGRRESVLMLVAPRIVVFEEEEERL